MGIEVSSYPDPREIYEDKCSDKKCNTWAHNAIRVDTTFDDLRSENFTNSDSNGMLLEKSHKALPLSEDQLILLPYRVHGFSLRSRNWGLWASPSLYFKAC